MIVKMHCAFGFHGASSLLVIAIVKLKEIPIGGASVLIKEVVGLSQRLQECQECIIHAVAFAHNSSPRPDSLSEICLFLCALNRNNSIR